MEQPVIGFVYHSGALDSDGQHAHELFLINWDGVPMHVHEFSGVTSFDAGHRHAYIGTTAPAQSGVSHTHSYYTVTTFDDGHSHVIRGVTGPEIELPGGGHYHVFAGYTTVDGRIPHSHSYRGQTAAS